MATHRNFMEPLPVHPKMQEDRRGKGVAHPVMDVAPFMTGEAQHGTAAATTAGWQSINQHQSCSGHQAKTEIEQVIKAAINAIFHLYSL